MRDLIRNAVNTVMSDVGAGDFEVSVLITDDEKIQKINKEFRGIDKKTDVLSFPMFEFDEVEKPCAEFEGETELGDIVISLETAFSQAEEYGHSAAREMAFLTVHSMLHLFGYDQMEENDRIKMRAREEYFLSKLGLERE